jgi:hypothetical protein
MPTALRDVRSRGKAGNIYSQHTNYTDNIVRLGLNYRLN